MEVPLIFVLNGTFETVTEESAEHGDAERRGFFMEEEDYDFSELIGILVREGYCYPSSSHPASVHDWISTPAIESTEYFELGEHTTHSLHLVDIRDESGASLPEEDQAKLWSTILTYRMENNHDNEELMAESVLEKAGIDIRYADGTPFRLYDDEPEGVEAPEWATPVEMAMELTVDLMREIAGTLPSHGDTTADCQKQVIMNALESLSRAVSGLRSEDFLPAPDRPHEPLSGEEMARKVRPTLKKLAVTLGEVEKILGRGRSGPEPS